MSALPLDTTTLAAAEPEEALTPGRMLAYGAPGFAGAAMAIPIGILMPRFYSDVVLAPLGTIALAMAIARSLDALTDPLMGWISDRTRSRWGRRKPWIALGVPPCAVIFYLLFAPPESLSGQPAGIWFGVTFALYYLFHTIYQIPHGALGAELALDYNERSRLFGVQSLFILVGVMVAAVAPAVLQDGLGMENERQVYALIAGAFAAALVILYSVLLRYVPERADFKDRESNPLVPGVRRALRNRPFRVLFIAGIIGSVPAAIPGILAPYYTTYVLGVENPDTWLGLLLIVYFGTGLLAVPMWMWLARRHGKLWTIILSSSIGIVGGSTLFFIPPQAVELVVAIFFLMGISSSTGLVILPSMGADVIDYDEFLTGKRREAQFGSFWAIMPKFVAIPGAAVPLAILSWVGYVPNQVQSPEVVLSIRLMLGVFPAAFNIAAIVVLLRYPISQIVHEKIRAGIRAHTEGEEFADPITGSLVAAPHLRAVDDEIGWFLDSFSPRELKRVIRKGAANARLDVLLAAAVSLAFTAGAIATAFATVPDLSHEPGPATVFAVVAAGLGITATVFHLLRLAPAQKLAASDIPAERIRAHLADTAAG
jgi:GPH family glycoside/pentoside/hexuronide:cation symporter